MKPTVAADEMFPEGVGPYMDLEEVRSYPNHRMLFSPMFNYVDFTFCALNECYQIVRFLVDCYA